LGKFNCVLYCIVLIICLWRRQSIKSNQSNLFATKQMTNFYSKARNMSTGHKGSFKTALLC